MTKKENTHDDTGALDCSSGATCKKGGWRSYFTPYQWSVYGVILLIGILLRWTMLDLRPYHHDESLHGMYGRYFYDFPDSNYYKYDPMLHGPMLYNSMRFIYATFGDSLWAARIPVCMMGTLFMLMPLLYRKFFNQWTTLILTAAVAFSPTMVYWSRFLREDYWVISGMLLSLYGFTLCSNPLRAFFVFLGITIQWCTKENTIVTLAVVLGYLVFEGGFKVFVLKERDTLIGRILKYVGTYAWETAWAAVVCFLIYAWFYGAGFRFPQGIVDGLGGKAFDYWSKHHAMERIKGPFNFHVYVMGWYEFPIFLAFLTHLVLFYRRTTSEIRYFAMVVLTMIVLSCAYTDELKIQENPFWKPFKLKDNIDIVGLFVLLFHAPLVTIHHLLKREYGLAATGYFFTATFFVYSYLGEKVPWLSVYPVIFAIPYLGLFFQDYFKKYPVDYRNYPVKNVLLVTGMMFMSLGFIFLWERKPIDPKTNEDYVILGFGALLAAIAIADHWGKYLKTCHVGKWIVAIAALFSIRAAIQTNFLYGGKETEYLSQVHTTYDVADVAKRIVDEVLDETKGYRPLVFVTGEATWPLAWYFRHLREEYKFQAKPEERSNFTYLFIDWKDQRDAGEIPEGYTARKMNLRGWWVPDFRQVTLKKFLRYSINHYPWNTSGFTYTTLLTVKDDSRFKK